MFISADSAVKRLAPVLGAFSHSLALLALGVASCHILKEACYVLKEACKEGPCAQAWKQIL